MTELVFSEATRVPLSTWDSLDIPQDRCGNYWVWDQHGTKYRAYTTAGSERIFFENTTTCQPVTLGELIDSGVRLYTQPPARKQTRVGNTLKTTQDFQTAPIGTVIINPQDYVWQKHRYGWDTCTHRFAGLHRDEDFTNPEQIDKYKYPGVPPWTVIHAGKTENYEQEKTE
jgi:hypothetical protein